MDSFGARAVILATGGFTRVFQPSTVSIGTTGDGHNLAYQVGVPLKDMEMVQFHPLAYPGSNALMITEAVLAEGAQVVRRPRPRLATSSVRRGIRFVRRLRRLCKTAPGRFHWI